MKRALIVVDLQNDYFSGGKWELAGIDAAASNAALVLNAMRESNHLVIHVRHEANVGAPFFVKGTPGAEIRPIVKNQPEEVVITKQFTNSFRDTSLKDLLTKNDITDVVVCGAMSHLCIDAVVRAASDFGYKTTVLHDACASRDLTFDGVLVPAAHVHAAIMASLQFGYANVQGTETFLKSELDKV